MTLRPLPYLALLLASCSAFEPDVGPLQLCNAGVPLDASVYGSGYPAPSSVSGADSGPGGASPATYYAPVSGNLLISDQYNNRVFETTRDGVIVFSFGDGSNVPGPRSVVAPNDAERLPGGRTLIAATGAPAGGDPACAAAGCPDNRVLIVDDATGSIAWEFHGAPGDGTKGTGPLNLPVAAVLVPEKDGEHVLVTDQGNHRILDVKEKDKSVTLLFDALVTPNSAERLPNGHTLVADLGSNQILELDGSSTPLWTYPAKVDTSVLNAPAFASRLANGNTLITDGGNGRVVEIDASNPPKVVWSYVTADRNPCSTTPPQPSRAIRLANDHTLISDQFNDQVLEVDHGSPPRLVYSYGKLGVWGTAPGLLWAPYDAKVIGDFTGLTAPK